MDKNNVGVCMKEILRESLKFRNFSNSAIEVITAKGYEAAASYIGGIQEKIEAAVLAFRSSIKKYGINIPYSTTDIILHGDEIPSLKAKIIKKNISEKNLLEIAMKMIDAIHQQHAIKNRKHLKNKDYKRNQIPRIDHAIKLIDPGNELYFIPLEFCPKEIIEEHYSIVEPILAFFGIAPSKKSVLEFHQELQNAIPMKKEYLESIIKKDSRFDPFFKQGSAPQILARKIIKANHRD